MLFVIISAVPFLIFILVLPFAKHHCLDCGISSSGAVWADTELMQKLVVMVMPPTPLMAEILAIVVFIPMFAMVVVPPKLMMLRQLKRGGSPASNLMALLLEMMKLNAHEHATNEYVAQGRQTYSCRRAFRNTSLLPQIGPFFPRLAEMHERCSAPKAW